MNGQDIEIEQRKAYKSMEESNKNAYEQDMTKAAKDKEYEIALAKKIFELRENGMQISIVEKMAKGDPAIAQLKFESAVCEASARASKENINIKKKLFDSYEATKKRELG